MGSTKAKRSCPGVQKLSASVDLFCFESSPTITRVSYLATPRAPKMDAEEIYYDGVVDETYYDDDVGYDSYYDGVADDGYYDDVLDSAVSDNTLSGFAQFFFLYSCAK